MEEKKKFSILVPLVILLPGKQRFLLAYRSFLFHSEIRMLPTVAQHSVTDSVFCFFVFLLSDIKQKHILYSIAF